MRLHKEPLSGFPLEDLLENVCNISSVTYENCPKGGQDFAGYSKMHTSCHLTVEGLQRYRKLVFHCLLILSKGSNVTLFLSRKQRMHLRTSRASPAVCTSPGSWSMTRSLKPGQRPLAMERNSLWPGFGQRSQKGEGVFKLMLSWMSTWESGWRNYSTAVCSSMKHQSPPCQSCC